MDTTITPFFSIAIPCWDIKGKGVEYLEYSFNILAQQTFTDFNVIISDHSLDDNIKNLCQDWSTLLNIKYIKNDVGRGTIAPNLNVAINNSDGKYIKILFQDDFLYDVDSLENIHTAIQNDLEKNWIITACTHTRDCINLYDTMIPFYHDRIHEGTNTISCPTVLTIKNSNPLLFDESLNWLVDVEYYKRLFNTYGDPIVINEVCAVNRDAEIRTTNLISEAQKQEETVRVTKMYNQILDLSRVTLIAVTSVRLEDHVKALEYSARNIKFGAIKIVSDVEPENLPSYITYEHIDKISNIDEWNYAMIYKLGQYIDTEFAMIVHDDGFIINPQSWRPEFFNYDYIGAPWPLPYDNYSYRDINGELIRVGNSVSLRSKKLIDLPNVLNMEWKSFHGLYSEDGFICVNNRHIYKEHGCKFADIDIAKYFSHETPLPETAGITPFAFHGRNSLPYKKIMVDKSPTKELVIAAYDKDLSWTGGVNSDVRRTVYRKGSQAIDSSEIVIEPNVGRCVHSFFNHIYTRYNSLSDYTFFAQDYPFDHWGNLLEILNGPVEDYRNKASLIIDGYYGYHNNTLGTAWQLQQTAQFTYGGTLWCLSNGHPHDTNPNINVDRYWDILFDEDKPSVYEFMPGGHFIITKQQILARPKEFYKKIVDLLEQEEIAPWLVERLECYIFANKYKIKQIN